MTYKYTQYSLDDTELTRIANVVKESLVAGLLDAGELTAEQATRIASTYTVVAESKETLGQLFWRYIGISKQDRKETAVNFIVLKTTKSKQHG